MAAKCVCVFVWSSWIRVRNAILLLLCFPTYDLGQRHSCCDLPPPLHPLDDTARCRRPTYTPRVRARARVYKLSWGRRHLGDHRRLRLFQNYSISMLFVLYPFFFFINIYTNNKIQGHFLNLHWFFSKKKDKQIKPKWNIVFIVCDLLILSIFIIVYIYMVVINRLLYRWNTNGLVTIFIFYFIGITILSSFKDF